MDVSVFIFSFNVGPLLAETGSAASFAELQHMPHGP